MTVINSIFMVTAADPWQQQHYTPTYYYCNCYHCDENFIQWQQKLHGTRNHGLRHDYYVEICNIPLVGRSGMIKYYTVVLIPYTRSTMS